VLDGIVARGAPVGANRAFAQLRKMSAWAVSRGIIERSPCEGISPPSAEKSRDRVLSPDEIRLVWRAADELGFPFGPITKLLILTGQRRPEVGGMEWNELDLENRLWTIPGSRAKNRRQHAMPLAPQAAKIIKSLARFSDSKFVFSAGKTAPSGFSRANDVAAGLVRGDGDFLLRRASTVARSCSSPFGLMRRISPFASSKLATSTARPDACGLILPTYLFFSHLVFGLTTSQILQS
jgi:integrase